MSVDHFNTIDNPISETNPAQSPREIAKQLLKLSDQPRADIPHSEKQSHAFDQLQRSVRETLMKIGVQAMQLFVSLQGDGDVGDEVTTEKVAVLKRSEQKSTVKIRSIFGLHTIEGNGSIIGLDRSIHGPSISRSQWRMSKPQPESPVPITVAGIKTTSQTSRHCSLRC